VTRSNHLPMTQQHTPPPELVEQWLEEADTFRFLVKEVHQYVTTRAAQWGADQELEACCEWIPKATPWDAEQLRAARRPKPKSEKQQALEALMTADGPDHPTPMLYLRPDVASIIRRAIESIPDPS
jgi:hypothetical protein